MNWKICFLVLLLGFISSAVNAQERNLEFEYRLSTNLSSSLEQLNNFNGEKLWTEGDLNQFNQSYSLDFRARGKFWIGFGFSRINFSQSALNNYQSLSAISSTGVLRAYETKLWYKLFARKNYGLGAYFSFTTAPITVNIVESSRVVDEFSSQTSAYNANLFLTKIGAKGFWHLKPITNLGIQAEAYASPIIVDNQYYSGNTASFQALALNGFSAGYKLGAIYKFVRLYAGIDFGQEIYSLGKNGRSLNHLKFSTATASAKVGFFFLK